MKLENLMYGDRVTIEIIQGEKHEEIKTRVVGANSDGVIVNAAFTNNHPYRIDTRKRHQMMCNLYCIDSLGERIVWKGVSIITITRGGVSLYAVTINKFGRYGESGDRRIHRRYLLDKTGIIARTGNQKLDVKIHDISGDGISFYTDPGNPVNGSFIMIYFDDQIRGHYFRVGVPCTRVRIVDEKDRVLHGCRITSKDKNLLEYLSLKRLEYQRAARE